MTAFLISWPVLALLLALVCGRVVAVCDRVEYPETGVVQQDLGVAA